MQPDNCSIMFVRVINILVLLCVEPVLLNSTDSRYKQTKVRLNATQADILRQNLLLNYNRLSKSSPDNILCTLGLNIKYAEVDESKSTVSFYGYSKLQWKDKKFKWNPEDYGDIKQLFFSQHDIWTPDLFLSNSAVSTPVANYIGAPLVVYSNGLVLWKPQFHFIVLCDLSLKYWPYDSQECGLKFLSWAHNRDHLDLRGNSHTYASLLNTSQWTIDKISSSNEIVTYNNKDYSIIWIHIKLSRYSPIYASVVLTPVFATILFILSLFWIPPLSNSRLLLLGATAVIISTCIFYYYHQLSGGDHVPSIISFYTNCLALICLAFVETIFVIRIIKSVHKQPLPWSIRKHLNGKFGKYFGFSNDEHKYSYSATESREEEMRDHKLVDDELYHSDDHHMIQNSKEDLVNHEWDLFVILVDRIFFICYVFIFLIIIISHVI